MTLGSDLETAQRLNHVEMVYRPGERDLASRVFELLGMRVRRQRRQWMSALVDPTSPTSPTTPVTRRRSRPSSGTLEQTLAAAMASGDSAGGHRRAGVPRHGCRPSRSTRSTSGSATTHRDDFDATLDASAPPRPIPSSPGASRCSASTTRANPAPAAPGMFQAFVRTDVVAGGLLAFGQLIELQWHLPNS